MKTVLALVYLSLIAALAASCVDRYSVLWAFLAWAVVVFFVGAILRAHSVINAPKEEQ